MRDTRLCECISVRCFYQLLISDSADQTFPCYKMEKTLPGLTRPLYLSRIGKAASLSVSAQISESTRSPAKVKSKKRPALAMAAFRTVSRRRAERSSHSESPDVGTYHPNYDVGRHRTDQAPLYKADRTEPRPQRIYLPACLTNIDATYPRHARHSDDKRSNSCFDYTRKRVVKDLDAYSKIIAEQASFQVPVSSPRNQTKGLVALNLQLMRPIYQDQPPSEHFLSAETSPKTTRSPPDFSKSLQRPELFVPRPLPEYRPNTRLVHRTSPRALDFMKRPGRKSLALDHMVRNPPQVNQSHLDKGWEVVQGRTQMLPKLALQSPRDDLMYRTTEAYKQNVPRRLMAMDVPSYQGELKEAMQKGPADITIYL